MTYRWQRSDSQGHYADIAGATGASYTLTQADIDAGQVVNPSSVVGTTPTGAAVTDTDTLTTPIPTGAAIDIDETAGPIVDANGNGVVDAGGHRITTERRTSPECILSKAASTSPMPISSVTKASRSSRPCW